MFGVTTLYLLIRELGGDRRTAMLGALVLAVNPLYFGLSNSFMTDVPFLSLVMIALYFLVRGFQRDSSLDLAFGILITFAAILVRQLGLVILLAFAVAYLIKNRFSFANLTKAIAPVLLGIFMHVGYQYWLTHTGRQAFLSGHNSIQHLVSTSISSWAWTVRQELIIALMYIGFFALPFVCGYIPLKPSGFINKWSKSSRLVMHHLCRIFSWFIVVD